MEIHPLQSHTLARRLGPDYRGDACPSHPVLCPPGHWAPEGRRVDNKGRPEGGRDRRKDREEERRERWRKVEEKKHIQP